MNWDRLEGNWTQFKGHVREKWGKLTDDDFDQIAGRRQILVGKVQERYGKSRDAVEKEVDAWFSSLDDRESIHDRERAANR